LHSGRLDPFDEAESLLKLRVTPQPGPASVDFTSWHSRDEIKHPSIPLRMMSSATTPATT